jgi:transposase
MESKKEYFERETKQSRYDKKLILDVVQLVEAGMSRKEANQKFELGASTLDGWMRDYGSEGYHLSKRKNRTPLEIRQIITEIEQGKLTAKEALKKYKVKSIRTIHNWLYKSRHENIYFSSLKEPIMARNKPHYFTENKTEQPLKKALEDAQLKIEALNTMIDVAEEQLKIDIRKKSGTKQ